MTDRIEHDAHAIAWPGRHITSGETVPGAGTWEIIRHPDCPGRGVLRALIPGRIAPTCATCGHAVVWQLSHMAASVAAEHSGTDPLP